MAYVYLLQEIAHQAGESGPWTKIGYSKNPPEWRLDANLKRGNPRTLRLGAVFTFASEYEARKAEKEAHSHFAAVAHQKEWFATDWQTVATWLTQQGYSLSDDILRTPA